MPKNRTMSPPKLLVADGDEGRCEAFRALLAARGAEVAAADGAAAARRAAGRRPAPDLALVDLGTLGEDALALCREFGGEIPTIVQLDAAAFTEENVGAALAAGASDCVMRLAPEALAPLLAAKLARLHGRADASAGGAMAPLVAGLTKTERRLLGVLLRNAGFACRRDYLHRELYGEAFFEGSRALDALVVKLRRGLGPLGAGIETVRGEGYRWNEALVAQRPRRFAARLLSARLLAALAGGALLAAAILALLRGGWLRDGLERAGEIVRDLPPLAPPSEGAAAALPGELPVRPAEGGISDPTGSIVIRWGGDASAPPAESPSPAPDGGPPGPNNERKTP